MAFIPRGSTVRATGVLQLNISQRDSVQNIRNRCIGEFRAFGWSVVSLNVTYVSTYRIQINFIVDFRVVTDWRSEQALAMQLSGELQAANLIVHSLLIKKTSSPVSAWF